MKKPDYLDAIKAALAQGYSVDIEAGAIIGKTGKPMKLRRGYSKAYPTVSLVVAGCRRAHYNVAAHKIVAFVLFGEAAFAPGVHVRHLDGDTLNIKGANFALGTPSMNAFDKPPEVRRAMAQKARAAQGPAWNRKFTEKEAEAIRQLCREPGDQSRVALLLGTHRTTVHKIVHGKRYPVEGGKR